MNSNINELSHIGGIRKKLDSHMMLDLKEGMKGEEEV
jgi:Holliday junction resolvasome RuvABC DNA-binding subunit